MKKNYSSQQKGFTLIELLVVTGVVVVISTIILSIIIIVFRGSKKAEDILVLKQNGSFAISQMVKQIRYAKSIDSPISCVPSVTQSSVTVTSYADGGQTTFSCPVTPTGTIASNSAALMDNNRVQVSSCSFTCTQQSSSEPPTISIRFVLQPLGSNTMVENATTVPFETSVTLRNYRQ